MSADHEFVEESGGSDKCYASVYRGTPLAEPCLLSRVEHPPAQVVEAPCRHWNDGEHRFPPGPMPGRCFCGADRPPAPTDPARKPAARCGKQPNGDCYWYDCCGGEPADEDEAAATAFARTNGYSNGELVRLSIAPLARFRAIAREQGRQAGAEVMREACAKWADTRPTYRCEDCGHEGRVVERSSCCGDQCPKCGGSPERIVVDGALVRALPIPESRS